MTYPGATVWSSDTRRSALGVPPLSIRSQLYHPARPAPICAIQGQTASGGASMVTAWVDVKIGLGTIAPTASGRRLSTRVAMQVAGAMLQAGASAVPVWTHGSRPQTTRTEPRYVQSCS